MKSITITGRLGKDSELRRTNNGDPILGFSVAVDNGYGQNKTTMWFDCSIWGKRGESLNQHLIKGTKVTAIGDFDMREYNGKTTPTINVQTIDFDNQKPTTKPQENRFESGNNDLDDDIPF